MRHAEGSHNIRIKQGFGHVGVHPSKWDQEDMKKFFNFICTQDLRDALLTEKGIDQCIEKQ
jgi:hypothetical protein